MSAVTPEMIEAANKIVPGANDASICAVYLAMKALDPEVGRMREALRKLATLDLAAIDPKPGVSCDVDEHDAAIAEALRLSQPQEHSK